MSILYTYVYYQEGSDYYEILIIPFPLINQRVKYRITIILPLSMGPVNNLG